MALPPLDPNRRAAFGGAARLRGRPFLRTTSGRRLIGYGCAFVVVVAVIINGTTWGAIGGAKTGPDSKPASRIEPVLLTIDHPPITFVPSSVRHRLLGVPNADDNAVDFGTEVLLTHLGLPPAVDEKADSREAGVASRPARSAVVDLVNEEAVADADAFRGGYVRAVGKCVRWRTVAFDRPAHPQGMIYEGILVTSPKAEHGGVMFVTTTPPPDYERAEDTLEVEGIFLNNVRYEAHTGKQRTVPCLVATSVVVLPRRVSDPLINNRVWIPMMLVLATGTVVITLILTRKTRAQRVPIRQLGTRPARPLGPTTTSST